MVTWSFATTALPGLGSNVAQPVDQHAIKSAFDPWEKVAHIDVRQVADSVSSNIQLVWNVIDVTGKTLGYANWQYSGSHTTCAKITFDGGDTWDVAGSS